jgi:hypothetical protein
VADKLLRPQSSIAPKSAGGNREKRRIFARNAQKYGFMALNARFSLLQTLKNQHKMN